MGTVHIIICNPIGGKKIRITFIADEQDGWEVSGDTDYHSNVLIMGENVS